MHATHEPTPDAPTTPEPKATDAPEPQHDDVPDAELLDLLTLILDGSLSVLDLCTHLALLPSQLADLLASPRIASQLDAIDLLERRRGDLVASRARPAAIGTLARAADGEATTTQRLAAAQLVRLTDPKLRAARTPQVDKVEPPAAASQGEPGAVPATDDWNPSRDAAGSDASSPPANQPVNQPIEPPVPTEEPRAADLQPSAAPIFTPTPTSGLAASAGAAKPAAVRRQAA